MFIKYPLSYLITDSTLFPNEKDFLYAIEKSIDAGIDVIQFREKKLSTARLYALASKIKSMISNTCTKLIINDRIDIMLASDADGIHLGWQSIPVKKTREITGSNKIIGVSLHNINEIKNIDRNEVNYITFSPIFHTPSKENILSPIGLSVLKEAVQITSLPIIALGGINESNLNDVLNIGAAGAAFVRDILQADDVFDKVKKINEICSLSKFQTKNYRQNSIQ